MWKTSFLGWALASMLILTGSAFADSFAFTSPGSVTWNGVYVNPYSATVKAGGTFALGTVLTIYCDDWNTDFSGNPTWNATVYSLTAGNASHFKYGTTTPNYNVALDTVNKILSVTSSSTPTPFNRYLEAAWLDEQWLDAVTQGTATADMQKELAAAVWTLFVDATHVNDPNGGLIGAINSSGYATAVNDYLVAAKDQVDNHEYTAAGWDVIVPLGNNSNGGPMQEFLVHAPEPSAVILLGTVIGYLGVTKFRRKRQA
jgi:hypothetical protein